MKPLVVGLLGCGTVGTGVARILQENADSIEARLGMPVVLGPVAVRDLTKPRGPEIPVDRLTDDAQAVLNDPTVQIVVEVIGGIEPARTLILEAVARGKHVVTANKALLAEHGAELFDAAVSHEVDIIFEASVGGGIPIIRSLREALASDRIESIHAIINGTSNFLLTALAQGDASFEDVLAEAQRLGYAEADPAMDVDGLDAAQKLSILLSLAFGCHIPWDAIPTRSIRDLETIDFTLARRFGFTIKPLAIGRGHEGGVEARVEPTLVPSDALLASVGGVFNAVFVESHALGPAMFHGRGAGMMPTAVSVVSDIIEVGRNVLQGTSGRIPHLAFQRESGQGLLGPEAVRSEHFLRFTVLDAPGVLARISRVLADENVSIGQVLQTEHRPGDAATVVILTHEASQACIERALKILNADPMTQAPTRVLRIARPGVV